MGVRGLTSFVSNRDEFCDDFLLKNTTVVLDANNLRYVLHRHTRGSNSGYGGDYDKYADTIRSFYRYLESANVSVILIYDGCYDKSGVKRKTCISRHRDHIRHSVMCGPETYKVDHYPVLGEDVFIATSRTASNVIMSMRMNYEADSDLATIAKILDIPILSDDSDFMVYNVDLIPLRSLDYTDLKNSSPSEISCRKFNKTKFMARYRLPNFELVYLMASILGNDYIPLSTFDAFFSQIPRSQCSKRTCSDRHRRIDALLNWLSRENDSVEVAIERMLSKFKADKRDSLRNNILKSMAVYKVENLDIDTVSTKNPETIVKFLSLRNVITDYEGRDFPSWFVNAFHRLNISCWMANSVVVEEIFFKLPVECRDEECVLLICLPLLQEILNCIFIESGRSVRLYYRERASLRWLNVSPVPTFTDPMEDQSLHERRKVLRNAVGIDDDDDDKIRFLEELPEEYRLLFYAFHFFAIKNSSESSSWHVAVFLILFLIRRVVDVNLGSKIRNQKKLPSEDSVSQTTGITIFGVGEEHLDNAEGIKILRRVLPYFRINNESPKKFDRKVVHKFGLLQTTFSLVVNLNQALNFAERFDPSLYEVWNGTFLYNLYQDVNGYANRYDRVMYILDRDSEFAKVSEKLWQKVESFLPHFSNLKNHGNNGRKVKRKTRMDDLTNKYTSLSLE